MTATSYSVRLVLAVALSPALPAASRSQGPPAEWRVAPSPIAEVGASTQSDILFSRIQGAVFLSDGRIAVADALERHIVLLDEDGAFDGVVGRAGEGPGEFEDLSAVWAGPDGGFSTWDGGQRRITHFDAGGQVLSTHRVDLAGGGPVAGGNLDGHYATLPDGRMVLSWIVGRPSLDGPVPDRMVLGLFGPDAGFQGLLGEHSGMVRRFGGPVSGPLPMSPYLWGATVGDRVAVTDGIDGHVRLFAPAEAHPTEPPEAVDHLTLQLPVPDRWAAWEALDAAVASGEVDPIAARTIRAADREEGPIPTLARLFSDAGGRLWVKLYEPASDALLLPGGKYRTGGHWWVIDPGGSLVATVAMPVGLAPLAVRGERMLALGRDAFGVERVVLIGLDRPN